MAVDPDPSDDLIRQANERLRNAGLITDPPADLSEGDLIFSPGVGLEGQVLKLADGRAQVWWSDDGVSWEPLGALQPLPTKGTP